MAELKPIETVYKGYRFRSRLEARWAVFFDELGIVYEYEPEGFRLEDGGSYLPDFWLPNHNAYVEVKGIGAIHIEQEDGCVAFEKGRESVDKYARFAVEASKTKCTYIIVVGDPREALRYGEQSNGENHVFFMGECVAHLQLQEYPNLTCETGERCADCSHFLRLCHYGLLGFTQKTVLFGGRPENVEFYPQQHEYFSLVLLTDEGVNMVEGGDLTEALRANARAAMAARQARFEHGESGSK